MADPNAGFRSERLVAEPLTAEHAIHLFGPLQESELYRFIPMEPPVSLEALRTRYAKLESRQSSDRSQLWLNWAMRAGDSYTGLLEATVYQDASAHIAYFVFLKHQGQGYGREGVAALIGHLAQACSVRLVHAEIDTRNRASQKLVEALGFARFATANDTDFFKGETSHEHHYRKALA